MVGFTDEENLGHDLFYNTAGFRGTPPFPDLPTAQCSFCHLSESGDLSDGTHLAERYTDDAYHNIGVPRNPELAAEPDPGIAGHAGVAPQSAGGFKTPTLRNVDKGRRRRTKGDGAPPRVRPPA